ncbi:hypothetical protein T08_9657 [Trichinella sp. T8]|nr:hypothetical protein T08_9657 [Trichinella sp. T8]
MDPNWKGIKSLMDFYPKSESNAKTGRDAPTDLADESASPQQPVRQKFPVITFADRLSCAGWYKKFKWLGHSLERDAAFCFPTIAVGPERIQSTLHEVDWDFLVSSDDKQTSEALYTNIEITSVIYPLEARHKELPGRRTLGL